MQLNPDQQRALDILKGKGNVFVTGGAGSGKSYLIRHFLREYGSAIPVLASTGAAAILVGGRTYHSFFGLGIMEGGIEKTVEKALSNSRLKKRLRETVGVVIDEVSMISGAALRAAEEIARKARESSEPWGGMRIIAVGDFSQLPPVTPHQQSRDWAFLSPTWHQTQFIPALLNTIERTQDSAFLDVLTHIRQGIVSEPVTEFLNSRTGLSPHDFNGTRMFPLRKTTEEYNLRKLATLPGKAQDFATAYTGEAKALEDLKRSAPVPEVISLKEGALVMLRQNDPEGRWVNGSLGEVLEMSTGKLTIELSALSSHGNSDRYREVEIEPTTFHLLDANGERVASAANFPVSLAYATTIHKAQGTTLDRLMVDLSNLWEPGQAYVALSRVREPGGLYIERWHPRSIKIDPMVESFHRNLGNLGSLATQNDRG
jgi:ATP-dependent exoDNAse (exonuclease V) alpha subunit